MDFKSEIINSIISGKIKHNQPLINRVKLETDNKKKQFEKFEQLLMSGIQNKKYNLSVR